MPMTREQMLAKLTANCSCDKDKAAFNELSNEMLKTLVTKDLTANVLSQIGKDFELPSTLALNEMPAALKAALDKKKGKKKAASEDDEEEEEEEEEYEEPTKNKKGKKPTTLNYEQWIALAPPDVQNKQRERDALSDQMLKTEKEKLVGQLTANVQDPQRRVALTNSLMQKPLADLIERAELLPPTRNRQPGFGPFGDELHVQNDADFFLGGLNQQGVQITDNSAPTLANGDSEGEGLAVMNIEWPNPLANLVGAGK